HDRRVQHSQQRMHKRLKPRSPWCPDAANADCTERAPLRGHERRAHNDFDVAPKLCKALVELLRVCFDPTLARGYSADSQNHDSYRTHGHFLMRARSRAGVFLKEPGLPDHDTLT